MRDFLRALPHNNLTRTILLLALAVAIIAPLKWFGIMALPVAWLFVSAALTLVTRKILISYVDLKAFALKSLAEPLSAAVFSLGVFAIMSVLIISSTAVLIAPYFVNNSPTYIEQASPVSDTLSVKADTTLLVKSDSVKTDSILPAVK